MFKTLFESEKSNPVEFWGSILLVGGAYALLLITITIFG